MSAKLEKIANNFPSFFDYPLRVRQAHHDFFKFFDILIKRVKEDEQIAEQLEEKNQLKLL